MTKEERHQQILDTLIKHESVQVSDLSALLEVSAVTIRKDLTELERANKLYRSHGKAILINPYINNRSVNEKEKLSTEEKNAIGRIAADMITKDDSIIIASGTTVHALARNIKPIHNLTVVSASLQVSEILANNEAIEIIQLGGMLRHSSNSVVGKYALPPMDAERYFAFFSQKWEEGFRANVMRWLGGSTNTIMSGHELYNLATMRVAQRTGVQWIDVTSELLKEHNFRAYLCDDGIHPNEQGQRKMAEVILAAMK